MWRIFKIIVGYTVVGKSITNEKILKMWKNIYKIYMFHDNIIVDYNTVDIYTFKT